MAFFRRPRRSAAGQQEAAVRGFWQWWAREGADQTAAAISRGDTDSVVRGLGRRLDAVDPRLSWQLSPGHTSEHLLAVSAEGDPAVRPLARRWRLAAPAGGGVWSFADSRQPSPDPANVVIQLEDRRVDLASATAEVRVIGARLAVTVHHPAFDGLSDMNRARAAYLLLDTVLGEADVETWVGALDSSAGAPDDPVPLTGLPTVVADLRRRHLDEHGRPVWTRRTTLGPDGRPSIARAQVPLSVETSPHLDTHVVAIVPFRVADGDGQPVAATERELGSFQRHLDDILGESGRVVAHETHAGRRLLHVYVDSLTPAVEQLRVAVAGWSQGVVQLAPEPDPTWTGVRHLGV